MLMKQNLYVPEEYVMLYSCATAPECGHKINCLLIKNSGAAPVLHGPWIGTHSSSENCCICPVKNYNNPNGDINLLYNITVKLNSLTIQYLVSSGVAYFHIRKTDC